MAIHDRKVICIGHECWDSIDCDMRKQCKYRVRTSWLRNLNVRIRSFFQYRLHIKLPHLPFFVTKHAEHYSGSSHCPFHKSRHWTCIECKHAVGWETCDVPYEDRGNAPLFNWEVPCERFEKADWVKERE